MSKRKRATARGTALAAALALCLAGPWQAPATAQPASGDTELTVSREGVEVPKDQRDKDATDGAKAGTGAKGATGSGAGPRTGDDGPPLGALLAVAGIGAPLVALGVALRGPRAIPARARDLGRRADPHDDAGPDAGRRGR